MLKKGEVKMIHKMLKDGLSKTISRKLGCKKRSKSDTYDTSVRTPMTVTFGQ